MVNPPLVTPDGQTTAPLAEVTASKKKSAFSFKWRSYNAENLNAVEMPNAGGPYSDIDHEVQSWDRFNFSYNVTDNVSVSLMPRFFTLILATETELKAPV